MTRGRADGSGGEVAPLRGATLEHAVRIQMKLAASSTLTLRELNRALTSGQSHGERRTEHRIAVGLRHALARQVIDAQQER